jgi:hypothetical protein
MTDRGERAQPVDGDAVKDMLQAMGQPALDQGRDARHGPHQRGQHDKGRLAGAQAASDEDQPVSQPVQSGRSHAHPFVLILPCCARSV